MFIRLYVSVCVCVIAEAQGSIELRVMKDSLVPYEMRGLALTLCSVRRSLSIALRREPASNRCQCHFSRIILLDNTPKWLLLNRLFLAFVEGMFCVAILGEDCY